VIFGLLITLFVIVSFLLMGIILLQQGKGDMGFGGSQQMLFGGSGGQELFEKTTWILAAIFIFGSFGLAVFQTRELQKGSELTSYRAPLKVNNTPTPPAPEE
jgi:protein translocase SecG subunit